MKTYSIDKNRVSYLPRFDVLYIGYGDGSLDYCDEVADIEPGITVMTTNGEFSGAEIYGFEALYGSLPAKVTVKAQPPFILDIPSI